MRKRFEVQLELGAVPIEEIEIPRSRDELPAVLKGLQWLFCHEEASEEVFRLLESKLTKTQRKLGREGLDLWSILVLGTVRLTLNCNYDRLHHVANYDSLSRQFLGERAFDTTRKISLTALKENVCILDEEMLLKINAIIAKHGQGFLQKKIQRRISKQIVTL